MNHGLINKHYHTGNMYKSQDIYETYPELLRIYNYFLKTNRRDRYYIAMKYHAIKVAQQIYPGIVLEELAELINIKTHSSVIYYLYKYIPIIGHDDFISSCFDRFIDNYIYPESIKIQKINQYMDYSKKYLFLQKNLTQQKKLTRLLQEIEDITFIKNNKQWQIGVQIK